MLKPFLPNNNDIYNFVYKSTIAAPAIPAITTLLKLPVTAAAGLLVTTVLVTADVAVDTGFTVVIVDVAFSVMVSVDPFEVTTVVPMAVVTTLTTVELMVDSVIEVVV